MKFDVRVPLIWGALLSGLSATLWAQSLPYPQSSPTAQPSTTARADNEDQPVTLEAFTVTGSNIRRIDQERTLPVTVLDAEDLAAFAAPTAADLLSSLPSGGVISLGESSVLGADARGDNTALNLRGIGSGNTLVLLNGRRLAPHPISQSEGGVPSLAVNVNQLPNSAVERVEVLREGASAIYGADAAAGVINYIVRRDYQGYEVKLRGSVTDHGGANDWRTTVTYGDFFNAGRTHVTSMIDFYHRDFLGTKDRWFSRDSDIRRLSELPAPWTLPVPGGASGDTDFDNRSSVSNYGAFVRGNFDSNGNFVGARPQATAATGTLTTYRGISTTTLSTGNLLTGSQTSSGNSTVAATSAGFSNPQVVVMSLTGLFQITPVSSTTSPGVVGTKSTTPVRGSATGQIVERDYYYNVNDHRTILPRTDRLNVLSQVDHEISDRLSAFGEVAYYRAGSYLTREPAAIESEVDSSIYIGINNPYNPFGSRYYDVSGAPNADGSPRIAGAPAAVMLLGVRPREFRPREVSVLSQSLRTVAGLRGKALGDFEWETGVMYSRAWTRDKEEFAIRHSALQRALLQSDPNTAFNPFGYTFKIIDNPTLATNAAVRNSNPRVLAIDAPFTNSDTVVNGLYDTFERHGRTELATWDAKINGSLFEMWGGRVGAAAGAEVRWEAFKTWYPPYHGQNPANAFPDLPQIKEGDNDFVGLSPNVNLDADRHVISGYSELLFPLVSRKNRIPLLRALEFGVAARYERFSDFGDVFTPKYSLAWKPFSNLLFRTSYNESFRAPNLAQTNRNPLQRSVSTSEDAYRYAVTESYLDNDRSRVVYRQDESKLRPEKANIATVGFAFEVPKVKGLTLTVDWWRIDQRDVIDNVTASEQLSRDQRILRAVSLAAANAGQNVTNFNAGSGTSAYVGNPKVTRAPVSATDQAAFAFYNSSRPPAEQLVPVGRVVSIVDDYLNLSGRDIQGFDMALNYRTPRFRVGQFTLRAAATYNTKFDQKFDEFSEIESVLVEDGRTKLRGNANLRWRLGKWSASWFAEYYGGSMDPGAATTAAMYESLGQPSYIKVFQDIGGVVRYRWWIRSTVQHSAYVEHRFGRQKNLFNGVTARIGVQNMFDAEPPLADEARGYQGGTVSAKGRSYYMELTKRF